MSTISFIARVVFVVTTVFAALVGDIIRDPRGFHRDVTARDNEFAE